MSLNVTFVCFILILSISLCKGQYDIFEPVYNTSHETIDTVSCSICDSLGLPLKADVRVNEFTSTCGEINESLSQPENRPNCSRYLQYLSERCCDWTNQTTPMIRYDCDRAIRDEIFSNDRINTVPPYPSRNKRIKIETHITFEMVQDLNIKESTASMYVTIYLKWHDPRLAWNISSTKCLSYINHVRASESLEETEIWVPNFNLLNRMQGTEDFAPSRAYVAHDGTVSWTQAGILQAICSFTGLNKIPYDTVGCQLIFSSPIVDFGYEFVTRNFTDEGSFQQKYKEYEFIKSTEIFYSKYRSGIIYNLYFERAHKFYFDEIILPTIMFTYASFGMFMLTIDSGERLGYGISVVLVTVAQEIITSNYVPLCKESLWLNTFTQISTYLTFIGLFESVLVSWLFHMSNRVKERAAKERERTMNEMQRDSTGLVAGASSESEQCSIETSTLPPDTSWMSKLTKNLPGVESKFIDIDIRMLIRRIDTFCIITLPIVYTISIIALFQYNKNMTDGNESWYLEGQEL